MNLVFDLGNSRLKWAYADARLHGGGAIACNDPLDRALDAAFAAQASPARVLAVSVAGIDRTQTLARWVRARWDRTLETVVASTAQCGVTNRYQEPAQLGADRWAALIAARARMPQAVCVVDCGTAVTVDALDPAGVFRGGVILPGLALQYDALQRGTDGIRVSAVTVEHCLARTTAAAVTAGVQFGIAGAIDRILEEQAAALGLQPAVLITGGDAAALAPRLRHATIEAPQLVLEGLARLAQETSA